MTFSPTPAEDTSHNNQDSQIARIVAEMAETAKKREAKAALDASKVERKKNWVALFKREPKAAETVG